MAYLNRHFYSITGHVAGMRCMFLAAILANFVLAPTHTALAAPITFRFDAQISEIPVGSPFDLGLEFHLGDTVRGKFTFEPSPGTQINDVAVVADQPYALEFNINGTGINTLGYSIVAFNDSINYDADPEGPFDGITLGCRETSCVPDVIALPQGEPFRVRSTIELVGSSSVWSTPAVSQSIEIWNEFALRRRLFLTFDNLGPGSMGFYAMVGPMVLVPEPPIFRLFLPGLCVVYGYLVKKRCQERMALN